MQQSRDQIIQNIFDNMSAIKRGMAGHMHALGQDHPVSHAQLELLFVIRSAQPVSFKQISQQLCLTPGAVSQVAEALEQHELISRHADKDDRRVQLLQVTKKGTKLLQATEKRRKGFMTKVMQDLSDEELAVWLRVQDKMLRHLQSESTKQTKQETK